MSSLHVTNTRRVKRASRAGLPVRDKRGGFTIVEVAMAGMVMALAISSSIIVLQHGLRALDTARYTTLAGQILQSQMEKLRLLSWEQLTHTGTPSYGAMTFTSFPADVATVPTAEMKRFIANGQPARCSQSIVPAETHGTTMMKITLTANWKGMDGRPHSLSYITYYGQYGLSDFFYTTHQ